ncbi:hypothetical protein K438DRAFT_1556305 [Mycena galopus ATCC 62051]|nr:hypothetical protein K438DRAFT_1556305 [Mycena galopus ATCC 62051]
MPVAIQALAKHVTPADELVENIPLILPSALSLAEHIKSRFLLYQKHNSRHQGMNTRSRRLVARNESKIHLHSEKFQMAWKARHCLAGGDVSKVGWPELKKEDICCMEDAEELSRNAEKQWKAAEQRKRKEDELHEDGLMLGDEEDDEMVTHGGESVREVLCVWTMAGTVGTDEGLKNGVWFPCVQLFLF